ncbi:MAG: M23 family metallopeptidase [Xenococcaceae cyanobacterium MO_167.B27]|nr:M23 family metallopeptidase [Xenococcaceae cyanobacterium MO_167.B27]
MSVKAKLYRLVLIMVATLLITLGLASEKLGKVKASNILEPQENLESTEIAGTLWTHGSFPVENFQAYTSPFGYRRSPIDGEVQFHNGLDMAAPLGSYVRSWWTGTVSKVSSDSRCGTSVTITSGEWEHAYCHLKGNIKTSDKGSYLIDDNGRLQIWQGQEVAVGARIGRVGMTGRTTGPHLHWVLRHNGTYVDPARVLKEMYKRRA